MLLCFLEVAIIILAEAIIMEKVIALTFDDGPNEGTTVQVLDVLQKHGVVATFFVQGCNINPTSAKVMQRAVAMGCEIGNHTETHPNLTTLNSDEIKQEVESTAVKIFDAIGQQALVFRAPFIAENDAVYAAVPYVFVNGYHTVDYDSGNDVNFRVEKAISQAHDGAAIIMHDFAGNHQTVAAVDIIIPALLGQGYKFVTASELVALRKPESMKYLRNM